MDESAYYEKIVFDHSSNKVTMLDALDICKRYIQQHQLVLVGGMSIDFALRSIGKQLYPDDCLPDYDFYSSTFHRDAYAIADALAKKYDGVNAINAFHISTMRVRINRGEVADITYVPESVLQQVPYLVYDGFRVAHPHYQMIDQHRALSLPVENPPLETVFSRWKKDITRFDLLNANFPMTESKILQDSPSPSTTRKITLPLSVLAGQCISGFASLLFWTAEAKKEGYEVPADTPTWCNSFTQTSADITVELPASAMFSMLSDDFTVVLERLAVINNNASVTYYQPLMDKIQQRVVTAAISAPGDTRAVEVIDNRGTMRSAHYPAGMSDLQELQGAQNSFAVSNLQEVLCYLLTLGIFYQDTTALRAYILALDILLWAADRYSGASDDKYLPTTITYGKYNVYEARVLQRATLDANVYGAKRTLFTPKRAYLDRNATVKAKSHTFIPAESSLFKFDGTETEPFGPRTL